MLGSKSDKCNKTCHPSWSPPSTKFDLKSLSSHFAPSIMDYYVISRSTQKGLNKKLRKPFWGASSQALEAQFCKTRLRQCSIHVFWCVSMPNSFMPPSCTSEKVTFLPHSKFCTWFWSYLCNARSAAATIERLMHAKVYAMYWHHLVREENQSLWWPVVHSVTQKLWF